MTDLFDFEELIPDKVPKTPLFKNATTIKEVFDRMPELIIDIRRTGDTNSFEELESYVATNKVVIDRYRQFVRKRDELIEESVERDKENKLLKELDDELIADIKYYISKRKGDLEYCKRLLFDKLVKKLGKEPLIKTDEIVVPNTEN